MLTVMKRYVECQWFVDYFIFNEKMEVALELAMMMKTPAFIRLEMTAGDVSKVEEFILLNL